MHIVLRAALLSSAILAAGTGALLAHDHGKTGRMHHETAGEEAAQTIRDGYFEDAQVAPRPLSDWAGTWQSVFPYLQDGTLAPVMEHKAKKGDKTAAEYTAYYETGYRTDVARIDISAEGLFIFHRDDGTRFRGQYESDGHEILTYAKGNRGVRFIFRKVSGDAEAPAYVQFSDHKIAPSPSDHFHLYWGEDRATLLQEVSHWPTYYPAHLTGADILREMLAH